MIGWWINRSLVRLGRSTKRYFYKLLDGGIVESKHDGGVFVTTVRPVLNKEEAMKFVEEVRERHSTATHNCWAYRLEDGARCNDDGEVGSPGKAILKRIETDDFINIAVVVTRYFGGKKVGMARVSQLFYNSAKDGLQKVDKNASPVSLKMRLVTSSANIQIVNKIIERNGSVVKVSEAVLPDQAQSNEWILQVPEDICSTLQHQLEANCEGKIKLQTLNSKIR